MATAFQVQRRTDGGAIASLVLGVLGFVVFPVVPSILAIWLGLAAKRRMRQDPSLGGEGLATAGVILGVIELALVTLAVALLVFLAVGVSVHSNPGPPVTHAITSP
jgi:uncharacterized membrane protein